MVAALFALLWTIRMASNAPPLWGQEAGAAAKKAASQNPQSDLPEIPALKVVEGDEWLTIEPFDRIFITPPGNEVYDVEPLEPRPLPKPTPDNPSPRVAVRLYEGDGSAFEVQRQRLKEIKYFEDMLLEQGAKHLLKDDLNKTFDYYQAVARRNPNWPGLSAKLVEYWYREGIFRIRQNDHERALYLLHEMKRYCAEKGLSEHQETPGAMGRAVRHIVRDAIEEKNYVRGRHFLAILKHDYPDHPVARELVSLFVSGDNFVTGAEKLRQQAKQKEAAGQRPENAPDLG